MSDGTVRAAGVKADAYDFSHWSNITAIVAGLDYTVGLTEDGTALATGRNTYGQFDIDLSQ